MKLINYISSQVVGLMIGVLLGICISTFFPKDVEITYSINYLESGFDDSNRITKLPPSFGEDVKIITYANDRIVNIREIKE